MACALLFGILTLILITVNNISLINNNITFHGIRNINIFFKLGGREFIGSDENVFIGVIWKF